MPREIRVRDDDDTSDAQHSECEGRLACAHLPQEELATDDLGHVDGFEILVDGIAEVDGVDVQERRAHMRATVHEGRARAPELKVAVRGLRAMGAISARVMGGDRHVLLCWEEGFALTGSLNPSPTR